MSPDVNPIAVNKYIVSYHITPYIIPYNAIKDHLLESVQTGSGVHPAPYAMRAGGFLWGKVVEA
jgi:hypothetical protein